MEVVMKKISKIIFSFLMVTSLLLGTGSHVEATKILHEGKCGNYISWALNSDGKLVISGRGKMDDYDHYDDREKKAPWDDYASQIKEIVIEEGIETVGSYAFCKVRAQKISIADSVKGIERGAFMCNQMTEIKLPARLEKVEYAAFKECSKLKKISIPKTVSGIGQEAFAWCYELYEIRLEEGIKSIGVSAFSGCKNLKSATLPKGLTQIGENAFDGCLSLKSIKIPNSIKVISQGCFCDCVKLEKVELPKNLKKIKGGAFNSCKKIKKLTVPASVVSIERYAIPRNTKLKKKSYLVLTNKRKNTYKAYATVTKNQKMTQYKASDVTGIKVSPKSIKIKKGNSQILNTKVFINKKKKKGNLKYSILKFSSSNTKVLTVTKKGKIKALRKGTSIITVKLRTSEISYKIKVTVK